MNKRSLIRVITLMAMVTPMAMVSPNLVSESSMRRSQGESPVAATPHGASLMFIANVGQFSEGARFHVYGSSHDLWLADDALWFIVEEPLPPPRAATHPPTGEGVNGEGSQIRSHRGVALRLSFPGANPHPHLEPFNRLDTHISYFIGNDPSQWYTDVPVWSGVRYVDLYPGIDLEFASMNGDYQQNLVVREGSYPLDAVRMRVEGADGLTVDEMGCLKIDTAVGTITVDLPQVVTSDSASPVDLSSLGQARVMGDEVLSPFAQTLDTGTTAADDRFPQANSTSLSFSTFVGGSDSDYGRSVAIDNSGNILVTGATNSSNFPTTPGAYDENYNGGFLSPEDVFVFKLSSDGSSLLYGTYIGGQGIDFGKSVIVDDSGNALVTGYAWSSNFPTTSGAYDESHNGNADVFVLKLSINGNALLFSTVIGANGLDYGEALKLDNSGNILLTGYAWSSNFPTTTGAYDKSHNGNADVVVLKLLADGSDLLYSTFVGGSGLDHGYNLAVDGEDVIISGYAWSSDFPTTTGAYDESHNGNADSFVLKLTADGSDLVYSTVVGSAGSDFSYSLAVDASGNAIVAGHTDSSGFPTTDGAFDRSFNGGDLDAFVYRLSADGSSLQYSTFVGGSSVDYGYSVTVDDLGQAVSTGYTDSADFPTTQGAYDEDSNGGNDVVLFRLSVDGRSLLYSTFIGGSGDDQGYIVTLDESGDGLVTGATASASFPTTSGAYDEVHNNGSDVFVLRMGGLGYSGTSFQIAGTVSDSGDNPISNVTISTSAGIGTTTDASGAYVMTGLITGTYILTPTKCGHTFSPATRTVSVPPDATGQDFTGTRMKLPTSQPIILVHGIKTLGLKTWYCEDKPRHFGHDTDLNDGTFGGMKEWFKDAGYDVWIAQLDTGPLGTPTIEENAQCLRKQIQQVLDDEETQGDQVILVAHSMGGLVSRACLNLNDCRDNVAALFTLGSPHAGINSLFLLKLLGYYKAPTVTDLVCAWQPAVCQFSTDGMLWFNLRHPNQGEIDYSFIGGTRTPFPLGRFLSLFEGRNDGVIGGHSAVGWLYPTELNVVLGPEAHRYWTGETHGEGSGYPSYFQASCGVESQAFCCVAWADCSQAGSQTLGVAQTEPTLSATTTDVGGHLTNGQSVNHTLQMDTIDHSLFLLSWITGTFSFTLTQPNGQVITPAYADAHTDVVTYTTGSGDGETPPFAAYAFTTTLPGLYTVTIGADKVGSDGTGYLVSAALETGRTFSVTVNADLYQAGDTAVFTATLLEPSGGIVGAEIQTRLTRMDGVTDTLTLADLGGGTYRATYTIPDVPGYLQATFTAIGDDGGTAFTRQVDKLLTIAPHDAQLAGTYTDWPEDADGDGFNDTLALDIGVVATRVGTYTLSAGLVVGEQTIVHATHFAVLGSGMQTVTLRFNGWDIRRSQVDGPYTVTHAHLVDLGVGGVPAQMADDVWETRAYKWQSFGFESLYLPVVLRSY